MCWICFFWAMMQRLRLGVQMERERKLLLFLAAALAASCVSVSGGISFIGLVAPHIARRLVGARHRLLLGASVLTGGILLVLAIFWACASGRCGDSDGDCHLGRGGAVFSVSVAQENLRKWFCAY